MPYGSLAPIMEHYFGLGGSAQPGQHLIERHGINLARPLPWCTAGTDKAAEVRLGPSRRPTSADAGRARPPPRSPRAHPYRRACQYATCLQDLRRPLLLSPEMPSAAAGSLSMTSPTRHCRSSHRLRCVAGCREPHLLSRAAMSSITPANGALDLPVAWTLPRCRAVRRHGLGSSTCAA